MKKLAVDVVLLPPKKIAQRAIEISGRLWKKEHGSFALGKKDYFPHITLAMGILDEKNLAKAIKSIEMISRDIKPFLLTVTRFETAPSITGNFHFSGLEIGKTPSLEVVHKKTVNAFTSLFSFDPFSEMFVEPKTVKESTIENFPKKSKLWENYHPHITVSVGMGKTEEKFKPVNFIASTLALCQLGQFGTCRKILFSTQLTG